MLNPIDVIICRCHAKPSRNLKYKKVPLMRRILDRIKGWPDGCRCPAYWSQQNYDDWDEGCWIRGWPKCEKCWKRFLPAAVVRLLVKQRQREVEKWMEESEKDGGF